MTALLYHIHIRRISHSKVEVTYVPTKFGRWFGRRVRSGIATRLRDDNDHEWHWWWVATERFVGYHVERYIEMPALQNVEDMTVEQLLLEEPKKQRRL